MVNVIVILRSNSRRKTILGHRYARWLVGPRGACFARAGGALTSALLACGDALPEVRAPAQEPHRRHSCLGMEPAGIPFLQEGEEVNCNLREQSERRDRAPLLKESMKVVRGHFRLQENKWLNPTGFHGDNTVLVLQCAPNDEERPAHNRGVFLFEKRRRDDDVGNASFILKTEKHKPFGSSGALASDDGTGHRHECAVRQRRQS